MTNNRPVCLLDPMKVLTHFYLFVRIIWVKYAYYQYVIYYWIVGCFFCLSFLSWQQSIVAVTGNPISFVKWHEIQKQFQREIYAGKIGMKFIHLWEMLLRIWNLSFCFLARVSSMMIYVAVCVCMCVILTYTHKHSFTVYMCHLNAKQSEVLNVILRPKVFIAQRSSPQARTQFR